VAKVPSQSTTLSRVSRAVALPCPAGEGVLRPASSSALHLAHTPPPPPCWWLPARTHTHTPFSLVQLAVLSITDHFTRVKMGTAAAMGSARPRVFGMLFGRQSGRRVEIYEAKELNVVVRACARAPPPPHTRSTHTCNADQCTCVCVLGERGEGGGEGAVACTCPPATLTGRHALGGPNAP
jgi:hypothetical protein